MSAPRQSSSVPLSKRFAPAFLRSEIERIARKAWRRARRLDDRVVRLPAEGTRRASALVSYILDPYLLPEGAAPPHSHTHFWESLAIGRLLSEQGVEVDAISWQNLRFMPAVQYDFLIDVRLNLERLAARTDAIKIFHADTAHWSFNNRAQLERHRQLTRRRGVELARVKLMPENRALESCDHMTYLGNDFTRETYDFAGKPSTRIPVSVPCTYDWPESKDFERARRTFLWFGSGGLVHKGLDLVLEAFAGLPELNLVVCGPIRKEPDFEREYARELYHLHNIETLGWVDILSPQFRDVAARSGALVYPSCSEGGGTSALTCMHAGIVPVLTREASVDLSDSTGITLAPDQVSVEGIRDAAQRLSERPAEQLSEMARASWQWSRDHHSREHFERHYRAFVSELLDG